MTKPTKRPSRADLLAAADRTLTDLIAPGLRVLFCGINPACTAPVPGITSRGRATASGPRCTLSGFTPRSSPSSRASCWRSAWASPTWSTRTTGARRRADARGAARGRAAAGAQGDALPPGVSWRCWAWAPTASPSRGRRAVSARRRRRSAAPRLWVLPNPSGLNAHYQLPSWPRCSPRCAARGGGSTPLSIAARPAAENPGARCPGVLEVLGPNALEAPTGLVRGGAVVRGGAMALQSVAIGDVHLIGRGCVVVYALAVLGECVRPRWPAMTLWCV